MKLKWKNPAAPGPQVRENNGVIWLSYPMLEQCPGVRNAFSTREGGVSQGIWSTMNLSYTRGDDPEHVTENYRRFAAAAGFRTEDIVSSDQTHTTNVRHVTEKDRGSGITREREFHDTDGLITDTPGVVLATYYADCVPLYFVDPVHRAIGLSHSGWRGTVHRMGAATIEAMRETFGTNPSDLLTAIGPSICQDCYEVSEDVIERFAAAFPAELHNTLYYRKPNGRYQLNLWEANRRILLESGVPAAQIQMPNLCTCCNPTALFSHRATQGKTRQPGCLFMDYGYSHRNEIVKIASPFSAFPKSLEAVRQGTDSSLRSGSCDCGRTKQGSVSDPREGANTLPCFVRTPE